MSKKVSLGTPFETVNINVYDIKDKRIVFTGSQSDAANFIGTTASNISASLRLKTKIKKQYAVRIAKNEGKVV